MKTDVSDLVVGGLSVREIIEAARAADPVASDGIDATAKAVAAGLEALKSVEARLLGAQDIADMSEIVTRTAEDRIAVEAIATAIRFEKVSVEAALTRMKTCQRGMARIVNTLHRAVNDEAARQAEAIRESQRKKRRRTGLTGMFDKSPIPVGMTVPAGYIANRSGVYVISVRRDEDVEEQITTDPLFVTARKVDLNGGEEILSLSWLRGGEWMTVDADRRNAFQARELVKLSGAGAPVASDNAAAVVRYLRLLEGRNFEVLPESKVSRRLGWIGMPGSDGFLYGVDHVGGSEPVELLAVDGYEDVSKAYRTKGTFEGWLEAIEPAIERPVAMSGIYAAVASLIVDILEVDNFIVDYAGMSGGGKTTTAMIAASVFGNPNKYGGGAIHGWDSNTAFIDRLCDFIGGGFPFILDESQKAPHDSRVKFVVYQFANGASKGRAKPGSIQRGGKWRNVMISTGEQPLTEFIGGGRAEGVGARILHFSASPFGERIDANRKAVDRLTKGILRNYGHLGRRAVEWLVQNRDKWSAMKDRYEALVDEYSARPEITGSGYRIAKYVAALNVAADLCHSYLDLPRPFGGDAFVEVWKAAARSVAATDNASDALETLYSFAVANQSSFYGRHDANRPPREWFGTWKGSRSGSAWNEIAISKVKAIDVLKAHGFSGNRELTEMNRRGWLSATTSKRRKGSFEKSVRVDGSPTPCICLTRSAVKSIVDGLDEPEQASLPVKTAAEEEPPPF